MKKRKFLISLFSIAVLLLIWQLASALTASQIILPSPLSVLSSLCAVVSSDGFAADVASTVLRALRSFVLITVCGAALGIAAGRSSDFETAMRVPVTLLKATPVMSVILLAYIWFRTGTVPVFASFLMAFPVMFVQTVQGVRNLDPGLEQMCSVYEIRRRKKLFNFTLPALVPCFITGSKQCLAMIWKVVIAAEVLTIPNAGVGRQLQLSQIRLDTGSVFAWTVIAVILTFAGDLLFDFLLRKTLSGRYGNAA